MKLIAYTDSSAGMCSSMSTFAMILTTDSKAEFYSVIDFILNDGSGKWRTSNWTIVGAADRYKIEIKTMSEAVRDHVMTMVGLR